LPTVVAKQPNFQYFRYTDDDGGHWSVKIEKEWGEDTDSGFAAFNAADPILKVKDCRNVRFFDPNTGRTTVRAIGNTTSPYWDDPTQTLSVYVQGETAAITYSWGSRRKENIPFAGNVFNKPDASVTT